MNVAHVIVNNLGGITSLVQNLILYKGESAIPQDLILLDIKNNPNEKAYIHKDLEKFVNYFALNPLDNWYYTYGKLAKRLSETSGVLVSNDQYDLIMLQAFNIPRKVVQLVHDPYNLDLSLKFHNVIDCFIAHSRYIFETLVNAIPQRANDIYYIPYGIPLTTTPVKRQLNLENDLKMIFLGRHDISKGVYDLYQINTLLQEKGIAVNWLILGKGPETKLLKKQWDKCTNVQFETPDSFDGVVKILASGDVMVFPTKFEGFPVALLECMSQGCVPIVTDLPGGIRELVLNGINGFKCAINDNESFAAAIEKLHTSRPLLLEMQKKAIEIVSHKYNAIYQSPCYQEIFYSLANSSKPPRHYSVRRKIGSRLDNQLFPTFLVSRIRSFIRNHESMF